MRWIFFIFFLFLCIFFLFFWLRITSPTKQFLPPEEDVRSQLNVLLRKEFTKRIPKTRDIFIKKFPSLEPWHRMTDAVACEISIPSIKIKNPEEAIGIALPYFRAYVDTINNVREIRPFLVVFPMSFYMSDFFMSFAGDELTHNALYFPYIASIMIGNNLEINCFYKNITLPNGRNCSNIYRSIYDKSKGMPEEIKQAELPRFDSDTKKTPIQLPETKRYSYFNDSGKEEYDFCQRFAKQNGLAFLSFELSFPAPIDKRMVCADLAYAAQGKSFSLEETRNLALRIQKEQALFYNDFQRLPNFVNCAREEGREVFTNPINAQRYLGYRVSFWDEYLDRVKPPAIAEVRVYKTKAQYFVSDELQRLQLFHEEEFPPFELDVPYQKSR